MIPINPRGETARFYPWHIRAKLVDAAKVRDYREIDALTDTLVQMGLARPRNEDSTTTQSRADE
jgi:hypothetical protein